eukprot:scaffold70976_cov56-Phaeocystis_antarctica.AAC.2
MKQLPQLALDLLPVVLSLVQLRFEPISARTLRALALLELGDARVVRREERRQVLRAGKPWRSVLALFVHQSRTILRPRELIVEPEHLLSQERGLLHHLATEAGSGGGASLKRFTVAAWGVSLER